MEKPRSVGIAVSRRETAQAVFSECKRVFKKSRAKTIVAEQLELETLRQNRKFLESDIIICFGGDGTFLKVCQAIEGKTPVFPVGCGERNLLATIEAEDAPQKIEEILQGRYSIEARNRIQLDLPHAPPALNEIIVSPQKSATVLHYELALNNHFQWQDYADGILIATPTGSRAYFASLHNPTIEPKARVLGIAPINSIERKAGTIVEDSKTIAIENVFCLEPVEIILDGQHRVPAPNKIRIGLSKKVAWIGTPIPGNPEEQRTTRKNLKPGSRFVLLALTIHGAGTQEDLVKQTGLNARTIRRALKQLVEKRLVSKRQFDKDQRQQLYHPQITKQMQKRFLEENRPGHVQNPLAPMERLKKRLME